MPPFWAPEMVTGPLAFSSLPLPVSPPLTGGLLVGGPEDPLPPHAARASSPTDDRATSGVLSRMYAPFGGCVFPARPSGVAECTHRHAAGAGNGQGTHTTSR